MSRESDTLVSAGELGLRLWLCPCCDAYALEVGNVLLRLSASDLGILGQRLTRLLGESLPERFALVLSDGINLLLTPAQAWKLAHLLAKHAPRSVPVH